MTTGNNGRWLRLPARFLRWRPVRPGATGEDDALLKEYYALLDVVRDFDKNLLTVKGWGATVSLVALGAAFQTKNYAAFLIACVSGVAFWAIEAAMQRHQMRYYPRMREIEAVRFQPAHPLRSTPQIDWSWSNAPAFLRTSSSIEDDERRARAIDRYYGGVWRTWLFWLGLHVSMPHVISIIAGAAFFLASYNGLVRLT
jgi:hypothetical protein